VLLLYRDAGYIRFVGAGFQPARMLLLEKETATSLRADVARGVHGAGLSPGGVACFPLPCDGGSYSSTAAAYRSGRRDVNEGSLLARSVKVTRSPADGLRVLTG